MKLWLSFSLLGLLASACTFSTTGVPLNYSTDRPVLSFELAKKQAKARCEAGDGKGCLDLSGLVDDGWRVHLKKACSLGEPMGCLCIAEKEPPGSGQMQLLEKACELGLELGCSFRDKLNAGSLLRNHLESHRERWVAEVTAVHYAVRDKAKACFDARLAELGGGAVIRGQVTTYVSVGSNGEVLATKVAKTTLEEPKVEACLLRVLEGLEFPTKDRCPIAWASYPWWTFESLNND